MISTQYIICCVNYNEKLNDTKEPVLYDNSRSKWQISIIIYVFEDILVGHYNISSKNVVLQINININQQLFVFEYFISLLKTCKILD